MPARTIGQKVIHYEQAGRGTPLVLLHGYPLDARIWSAQREALSDQFQVITPDLPGFGESKSSDPFTIQSLADDVHALLQALGATQCVLGGLSMGGYVALAYARKYLPELRALVLIDTRAEGDSPQGKEARMKAIETARTQGSREIASQMLPKMLAPGAQNARPELAKQLMTIMESCPALTIEHALLAMRDRADQTAELPSLALPTLILVGDGDAITPPSVAESMQRAIPSAQLTIIHGAGHMTPMEQPDQVNRAMRMFLQTLAAG